ncbi:MAG: hypothetical protein Q9192_007431 [Flavoplaca navasiana]
MSYGYSVGDFVLLGQLAWTVFKSCRSTPESFANISNEVLSLYDVVKELSDNLKKENPPSSRLAGLQHVAGGCQRVLSDLQVLTDRYRSLGTQNKRTRDRLKWGGEDITEIRLRLISNTALLNAFISTSQITIQKQLQQFLNRHQRSGKEGSVISSQSLSSGDSETWRDIRRELEGFGISVAAFNTNKAFIFDCLQKAIRSGKLDNSHDCSISTPSVSSENSKLWREIRKDLEGVGVTPATFSLRQASVIESLEQSFQPEDFQQSDDYHMEENNAYALLVDAEPYPCKDRVNEWLLQKLETSPVEMIRYRAEMKHLTLDHSPADMIRYRALDHESWWSLVTQHWALDGAGDVANSIENPPGLTEDSLSMTKGSASGIIPNSPEITKTESLPKNTHYERPSHAAPSYQIFVYLQDFSASGRLAR